MNRSERILYLDILRIIATIAVVVIHVISVSWGKVDTSSTQWNIVNIINAIVRPAVPIFVMISGALFLNAERVISIQIIFKKYILKICIALVIWNLFYALVYTVFFHEDLTYGMRILIAGYTHMWYLYMCIGLYLITPLIRQLVSNEKLTLYFLILSLIFTIILPAIIRVSPSGILQNAFEKLNYYFTLGYVPYFVAGYYFSIHQIPQRAKSLVYLAGGGWTCCKYYMHCHVFATRNC